MSVFSSAGDGGAAHMERARQTRVAAGKAEIDRNFAGFDPAFYDRAKSDYTAAVTPGMFKDYQNTKNNLTYALSRAGGLNSSTAVQRNESLSNELAKNESVIANNAQDQSNRVQGQVNAQKGQLVQQLEASSDPAAINAQSAASASQLRAPSVIQPLGNLFADWSSQYLAHQNTAPDDSIWSKLTNQNFGQPNPSGGSSYMVS